MPRLSRSTLRHKIVGSPTRSVNSQRRRRNRRSAAPVCRSLARAAQERENRAGPETRVAVPPAWQESRAGNTRAPHAAKASTERYTDLAEASRDRAADDP